MNNTYTFEDIFRGRMFRVPDYQRGYAWEPRHWNDLLEDLELLSPGRSHYTGTLVVRKTGEAKFRDEGGQTYEVFDVIDGQQRLTTVVIFLDSIHDELERLGKTAMADGLEKMYLAILDRNGQPQTKLTLNRDSQEFFYNNVLGFARGVEGTSIRSHDNLLNAHRRMDTYLSEQSATRGEAYADWVVELSDKITQGLIVLLHEVENETDAGVIFETMNDRGKVLTDLEKVKNHLLYLASKFELDDPHDLDERINATWNRYLNRFNQPDSIIPDLYNPQSLNRYSYTLNNPINHTDPSGHCTTYVNGNQCVGNGSVSTATQTSNVSPNVLKSDATKLAFLEKQLSDKFKIKFANDKMSWSLRNIQTAYKALNMIDNKLSGNLGNLIGGTTFTMTDGGNQYYGKTGSTGIAFHTGSSNTQIPLVNFLHETGHLLDNVPATADVFSGQLPKKPVWVKDGFVNEDILQGKLVEPVQAKYIVDKDGKQTEAYSPSEYWADSFANYVDDNINLNDPMGAAMSADVAKALKPYIAP